MSDRFGLRKRQILAQLGAPDDQYHDLSPKGSVDEPIRALIGVINRLEGLVTTSSCSGRISVFLEGQRADVNHAESQTSSGAGPGGKGGGGSWLFVSHDPIKSLEDDPHSGLMATFGLHSRGTEGTIPTSSCRYIHIKFEPMILHVLTASLTDSQRVLTAALNAGFRESGAVGLNTSKNGDLNPMVAVRSTGYSFDAIIGYQDTLANNVALVDEEYLRTLITIANERFKTNSERIARFQTSLLQQYNQQPNTTAKSAKAEWEDAEARKRRKRQEGLARQQALKATTDVSTASSKSDLGNDDRPQAIFD